MRYMLISGASVLMRYSWALEIKEQAHNTHSSTHSYRLPIPCFLFAFLSTVGSVELFWKPRIAEPLKTLGLKPLKWPMLSEDLYLGRSARVYASHQPQGWLLSWKGNGWFFPAAEEEQNCLFRLTYFLEDQSDLVSTSSLSLSPLAS